MDLEEVGEERMTETSSEEEPDDRVLLVVGTWNREPEGTWTFKTEDVFTQMWVTMKPGLTLQELTTTVRLLLNLPEKNMSVRFSFQYPEWLSIDDDMGLPPQYFFDDTDVTLFISLKESVEDCDLYVSYTVVTPNEATTIASQATRHITQQLERPVNPEYYDDTTSSDEDYHDFAIQPRGGTMWVSRSLIEELNACERNERNRNVISIPGNNISVSGPGETSQTIVIADKGKGIVGESSETNLGRYGTSIRGESAWARFRSSTLERYGTSIPAPNTISTTDKGKGVATVGSPELEATQDNPEIFTAIPSMVIDMSISEEPNQTVAGDEGAGPSTGGQPERVTLTDTDADTDNDDGSGNNPSVWAGAEDALFGFLTDFTQNPTLFDRDAPPVYNDETVDAIDDLGFETDKIFVGRVFKSKEDCKIKLAIYAINRRFHFRTTRSTPKIMVVRCISPSCPWRVYASAVDNTENFQIRQASLYHDCTIDHRREYHRLATTQVIGEMMASRFIGIKKGPTPASIRKILLDEFHVHVSYWKAWRAREVAMDQSLGNVAGSYALLPQYLSLLKDANPGSITYVESEDDGNGGKRFKYSFLAFAASINGFQWMRKVIVVDGTHLKARFGGCLISACCQDANFQIFPLAFGIVDSENDESWEWFFRKLNEIVPDSFDLVFVSDRHSSIYTGLRKVYLAAHHAACSVHLARNVKAQFKPPPLAALVSKASRALTVPEFNSIFAEIQEMNPLCAAYLSEIGVDHWSRAHFRGPRFNIMDSNIAESWNNVLVEAREYPLICMLEYIRIHVMSWFAIRRARSSAETSKLTPEVRRRVEKKFHLSTGLAVKPIAPLEFEVTILGGGSHVVKLDIQTCTCREFQLVGIPCEHALAAAARVGFPTELLLHEGYFTEAWANAYVEKIYPIPAVGGLPMAGLKITADTKMLPPKVRRPPGRPKKIRIRSRGEFKRKVKAKKNQCSRCFGIGHNRASCRNSIG